MSFSIQRSAMQSVAFLVAASLVSSAAAEEDLDEPARWYAGIEAGLGVMNKFNPQIPGSGETGFLPGGAAVVRVGRDWTDHVRVDGQIGWQGSSVDEIAGRLDIMHSTLNVYYDFFDPEARFRTYLGLGLGIAGGWLRSSSPFAVGGLSERQGVGMAYLIGGGARYALDQHVSLVFAWHFLGTVALIDNPVGDSIDPTMHAFMIGLQRSF